MSASASMEALPRGDPRKERREGRRIDLESAEEERRKELKVFPPFYTHYILYGTERGLKK